ncbi:MAG: prolipoprotein diacylglyceryl transferase, partial [SAR324 cluster bacterium]|nr:prolipoprotein diacylglyceryl transferase [SAR324 cluster bacterium]
LLGARTYEIVMEWSNYYAHQPFWKVFAVWQGGLAIHGGILGGSLFTIFYCHQKQISLGHVLDIAALCMIQGQAIGRWGNFTNGEAAGPVTKFWTGITFPPGTVIDRYAQGQPVHPTMIYESLGNVLIFLILWRLRLKHFRPGMLGALYLLGYSILRSALTPFRMDNQYLILGDTLILAPYAIGIVLTLVAVVWITRARLWKSDSLLAKNSPSARLSQKRR